MEAAKRAVVGAVVNPHLADDFAPFLAAARDSGATVVGIVNAHTKFVAAVGAVAALILRDRVTAVGLLILIEDTYHIGLARAQDLCLIDSWSGPATRCRGRGRGGS